MPPIKRLVRIVRPREPGCGKSVIPQENRGFLASGRTNLRMPLPVRKRPAQKADPEHVRDARTLTATALRAKYLSTYDSWKNMKSRRKAQGAIIAPEFETFSSFLIIQGPRPTTSYTLDRLDNNNPTYGRGLCQWRDKVAQANNRRSTIYLNHDGKCLALSEWARRTGQQADTMRKRKLAGWSDSEIVTGRRDAPALPAAFPWPGKTKEAHDKWEQLWIRSPIQDPLDFVLFQITNWRNELFDFLSENCEEDGATDQYRKEAKTFERLDKAYHRYREMKETRDRQAEIERLYRAKGLKPPTHQCADSDKGDIEDE